LIAELSALSPDPSETKSKILTGLHRAIHAAAMTVPEKEKQSAQPLLATIERISAMTESMLRPEN
jgi:hypothetical protein